MSAQDLKREQARSRRAEVASKLRRKRERKAAQKRRVEEEVASPVEQNNKKKDTVWKIIMPGKNREHATFTEAKVV